MTKGFDKPGPTPRSLLIIKLFLFEDSGRRDRNGVWEGSVAIGGPDIWPVWVMGIVMVMVIVMVVVMVMVIVIVIVMVMVIVGHRLTWCSKF